MTNKYNLTNTHVWIDVDGEETEFQALALNFGDKELFAMTDPKMAGDVLRFLAHKEPADLNAAAIEARDAIKARWQFGYQRVIRLDIPQELGIE